MTFDTATTKAICIISLWHLEELLIALSFCILAEVLARYLISFLVGFWKDTRKRNFYYFSLVGISGKMDIFSVFPVKYKSYVFVHT